MRTTWIPAGARLVVGALLASCLVIAGAHAADMKAFEAAYEAADAERKKAAEVKYEWRDTKKLLKRAKKLADKGEFDKAIKLADKARSQGMLAQEQAVLQAEAWKAAVVR